MYSFLFVHIAKSLPFHFSHGALVKSICKFRYRNLHCNPSGRNSTLCLLYSLVPKVLMKNFIIRPYILNVLEGLIQQLIFVVLSECITFVLIQNTSQRMLYIRISKENFSGHTQRHLIPHVLPATAFLTLEVQYSDRKVDPSFGCNTEDLPMCVNTEGLPKYVLPATTFITLEIQYIGE